MTNNKLTTIYIVRHGETEFNVERIMQGHVDSPLTKKGLEQAKYIANKFKDIKFKAVFSSDLPRAKRTAEIITLYKKIAVITSRILRERCWGRFDGKPIEDYRKELRHIFDKFDGLNDKQKFTFKLDKTIESDEQVIIRFLTFLREIAMAYLGKTILIVTHGSLLRTFLIHLGYGTYKELDFRQAKIENTAYTIIQSDGVDFFIKEVNGVTKAKT